MCRKATLAIMLSVTFIKENTDYSFTCIYTGQSPVYSVGLKEPHFQGYSSLFVMY